MSDPRPEARTEANAGVGWFEWFEMPANMPHVAYVHEGGSVYDPELGWDPEGFTLAAASGNIHRLVRLDLLSDERTVEAVSQSMIRHQPIRDDNHVFQHRCSCGETGLGDVAFLAHCSSAVLAALREVLG